MQRSCQKYLVTIHWFLIMNLFFMLNPLKLHNCFILRLAIILLMYRRKVVGNWSGFSPWRFILEVFRFLINENPRIFLISLSRDSGMLNMLLLHFIATCAIPLRHDRLVSHNHRNLGSLSNLFLAVNKDHLGMIHKRTRFLRTLCSMLSKNKKYSHTTITTNESVIKCTKSSCRPYFIGDKFCMSQMKRITHSRIPSFSLSWLRQRSRWARQQRPSSPWARVCRCQCQSRHASSAGPVLRRGNKERGNNVERHLDEVHEGLASHKAFIGLPYLEAVDAVDTALKVILLPKRKVSLSAWHSVRRPSTYPVSDAISGYEINSRPSTKEDGACL